MKPRILFATTALLACAAAGRTEPSPRPAPREIRFAIIDHRKSGDRYYVEAAKRFKREVEARTEGRLRVSLIDYGIWARSGRESAQIAVEKLASGEIEMANLRANTVARLYEPRLSVFDLPYLLRDEAHVARVIEGPAGRRLIERLPERHIASLGYTYSGGFRILVSKKPLSAAALRGLPVAMTSDPVLAAQFEAWGARALPTPKDDFMTVIKQGRVEAVETTWNCYEGTSGMRRALPVVNELAHNFYVTLMLANTEFLASLPERDRAAVVAAADEASRFERGVTLAGNNKIKARHLASGGQVVAFSAQDRRELAEASRPVRERFASSVGPDLIEAVEAAAKTTMSRRD